MTIAEAPGVVSPNSWVITLSSWPNLLQHLQSCVAIVTVYTRLLSEHLTDLKSLRRQANYRPFSTTNKGQHSGPASVRGELLWQPQHRIRRRLVQNIALWQRRKGKSKCLHVLCCRAWMQCQTAGWFPVSCEDDMKGSGQYGYSPISFPGCQKLTFG